MVTDHIDCSDVAIVCMSASVGVDDCVGAFVVWVSVVGTYGVCSETTVGVV